jgi:hypothetical protein
VGFVVDKVSLGKVFSEYYSFPCQAFHRLLYTHHHPSLPGAGTVGQIVDSVIVDSVIVDSVIVDSVLVDSVIVDSVLVDSVISGLGYSGLGY